MSKLYDATDIAKWFVAWAEDEEANLSNLKLQKLLYYTQGSSLGERGVPVFRDPIVAWSHGPVVVDVYHEYKHFGGQEVTLAEDADFSWDDYDSETEKLLIRVWNTYGAISAWKLRNMTHDEPPWQKHFTDVAFSSPEIPIEDLQDYFSSISAHKH